MQVRLSVPREYASHALHGLVQHQLYLRKYELCLPVQINIHSSCTYLHECENGPAH